MLDRVAAMTPMQRNDHAKCVESVLLLKDYIDPKPTKEPEVSSN